MSYFGPFGVLPKEALFLINECKHVNLFNLVKVGYISRSYLTSRRIIIIEKTLVRRSNNLRNLPWEEE